jgi:hypothetical protein
MKLNNKKNKCAECDNNWVRHQAKMRELRELRHIQEEQGRAIMLPVGGEFERNHQV